MEGIPTYVSAEKYAKYSGLGVQEVKRLCNIGDIPCSRTETGRYKIPIYKDGINKEQYEKVISENAELKSTLSSLRKILEVNV